MSSQCLSPPSRTPSGDHHHHHHHRQKKNIETWDDDFDFAEGSDIEIPDSIKVRDIKVNEDLGLIKQFAEHGKGA